MISDLDESVLLKKQEMSEFNKMAYNHSATLGSVNKPESLGPINSFLHYFALSECVKTLGSPKGKKICVLCGGAGMEAEYLSRLGATVVSFDISVGQIKLALIRKKTHNLEDVEFVVADIEHIPIASKGVDITFVYDGLCHVPQPYLRAISEMARISRKSIIVFDSYDAAITQLAMRLGLVERLEYGRLNVFRWKRKLLFKSYAKQGFLVTKFRRLLWTIIYRFVTINSRVPTMVFRFTFLFVNTVLGHLLGNRFIIVARRVEW